MGARSVSVIVPTYMQAEALRLTLAGLERQRTDTGRLEVIVVDDGSTDHTHQVLAEWRPPFFWRKILLPVNRGRSYSRNRGIEAAAGDIVLFLDGDIISGPNLVGAHLRQHAKRDDLFVSGISSTHGLYSVLHKNFSCRVIARILRRGSKSPVLRARLATAAGIPPRWLQTNRRGPRISPGRFRALLPDRPTALLKPGDLRTSLPLQLMHRDILHAALRRLLRAYGPDLSNFGAPWVSCITRNVSVGRASVTKAGLFDENFQGWGAEDWELGFRLYKNGVVFRSITGALALHQDHPVSMKRFHQSRQNKQYFSVKHPEPEIQLLYSLSHYPYWRLPIWARIITEYQRLSTRGLAADAPLLDIFRRLAADYRDHVVTYGDGPDAGRRWLRAHADWEDRRRLWRRYQILGRIGRYDHFLNAFNYLARARTLFTVHQS